MTDYYWVLLFIFLLMCLPAIFMGWGRPREKLFWPCMGLTACAMVSWVGFFIPLAKYTWEWNTTPLILFELVPGLIVSMLVIFVVGLGISVLVAGFKQEKEVD